MSKQTLKCGVKNRFTTDLVGTEPGPDHLDMTEPNCLEHVLNGEGIRPPPVCRIVIEFFSWVIGHRRPIQVDEVYFSPHCEVLLRNACHSLVVV